MYSCSQNVVLLNVKEIWHGSFHLSLPASLHLCLNQQLAYNPNRRMTENLCPKIYDPSVNALERNESVETIVVVFSCSFLDVALCWINCNLAVSACWGPDARFALHFSLNEPRAFFFFFSQEEGQMIPAVMYTGRTKRKMHV